MVNDIAVQELVNAIKEPQIDTNKTYTAKVARIDSEGVVWVNLQGSEKETPTASVSAEVERGDIVNVEWRNNKLYIVGNVTNPSAGLAGLTWAQGAIDGAIQDIIAVRQIADEAGVAAGYAMESANGKNTVYHMATAPSGGTYKEGDTWFNSAENYAMYTWNGATWVKEEFGNEAIADLAITNAKIANGTIQDAKISTLDAGKITAGVLAAARIGAGTITADKLDATDINASSTLTIGAMTTGTQNDILNSKINVGGRNLLRGTGDYYGCSLPTEPTIYYNWADNGDAQICKYGAYTGDLVWDAVTFRPFISYSAVRGKTVTLSFWYQSDSWSSSDAGSHNYLIPSFGLYTAHRGVSRHKWYSDYSGTAIPTASWKKYEITLDVTDALFNSGEGTVSANDLFTLQLYRHNKSAVQVKKVKLETGNKSTDWTPAPEDLQSFTGENILMDTNASSLTAVTAPAARYFSDVGQTNVEPSIVSINDAPIGGVSYGAKFVTTLQSGMTTGRCLAFYSSNGVKLTRHRVYTLSCWAKGTGSIRFQVGNGSPFFNNTDNDAYSGSSKYELSSSGWVKVQWSFYYDNQWNGTYPIIYYGVYGDTAGTVYLCGFKLEEGNASASWAINTAEAGKTATNYITEIDTRKGITIKPADSSGDDYVQLNSTDLRFVRNGNARTIIQDDWMCLGDSGGARITLSTRSNDPYIFMGDENNVQMFRAASDGVVVGPSGSGHAKVVSDGLHIYTGSESTAANHVAAFGATARLGVADSGHVRVNSNGLNVWLGDESTAANSVASFGTVARLGKSTKHHVNVSETTTEFLDGSTTLGAISSSSGNLHIFGNNGLDLYTGSGKKINMQATGTGSEFNLTSAAIKLFGPVTTNGNVTVGGKLTVDNASIQNLYGYNDTVSYATNMFIGNTGIIHRTLTTSSRRYKHDIRNVVNESLNPHNLYDIEVKQFKYNEDVITNKDDQRYGEDLIGFISEQVREHYPIAVDINEDGECESWNVRYVIPPMLALIQEQHEEIEALKNEVHKLKWRVV